MKLTAACLKAAKNHQKNIDKRNIIVGYNRIGNPIDAKGKVVVFEDNYSDSEFYLEQSNSCCQADELTDASHNNQNFSREGLATNLVRYAQTGRLITYYCPTKLLKIGKTLEEFGFKKAEVAGKRDGEGHIYLYYFAGTPTKSRSKVFGPKRARSTK